MHMDWYSFANQKRHSAKIYSVDYVMNKLTCDTTYVLLSLQQQPAVQALRDQVSHPLTTPALLWQYQHQLAYG